MALEILWILILKASRPPNANMHSNIMIVLCIYARRAKKNNDPKYLSFEVKRENDAANMIRSTAEQSRISRIIRFENKDK